MIVLAETMGTLVYVSLTSHTQSQYASEHQKSHLTTGTINPTK
jgi:hypothetical protein